MTTQQLVEKLQEIQEKHGCMDICINGKGFLCEGGEYCEHGVDSTHWVDPIEGLDLEFQVAGSNEKLLVITKLNNLL